MGNKQTQTILPIVRVGFYHRDKKIEKYFTLDSINDAPSIELPLTKARGYLASMGLTTADVNVYLIDKVNGEWRTDWELAEGGQVLHHPWNTLGK